MHTKIWNLRYDTWGASDIHNEHFARFILLLFIYHFFNCPFITNTHTLSPLLSESTKPKVNSYRCDVYKYTAHSNRNHCIYRCYPSIFQCLHSACNDFNIPTSSCDYLIFILFSFSTIMCGVSANETESTNNV